MTHEPLTLVILVLSTLATLVPLILVTLVTLAPIRALSTRATRELTPEWTLVTLAMSVWILATCVSTLATPALLTLGTCVPLTRVTPA